jgi:hypothetical protein
VKAQFVDAAVLAATGMPESTLNRRLLSHI